MNGFWSAWIIFLIVLNLGIALYLFVWSQRVDIPTNADGTTGHAWAHGVLRESVRRLPRWWVAVSGSAFAAAAIYLTLYPGFGGFEGLLRWTSIGEYQRHVADNDARLGTLFASLDTLEIDAVPAGHPAIQLGRVLYLDNCAACHGIEARGNQALGAPNLVSPAWMYGGDADSVVASILDGRRGVMPGWGDALGHDGVIEVAAYVRSLAGHDEPAERIAAGEQHYQTMCVACHGVDGTGMQALGAPDLTDDDWLYGGDFASVVKSIRDGRSGEMPAWRGRLSEHQARAIAAWLFAHKKEVRQEAASVSAAEGAEATSASPHPAAAASAMDGDAYADEARIQHAGRIRKHF